MTKPYETVNEDGRILRYLPNEQSVEDCRKWFRKDSKLKGIYLMDDPITGGHGWVEEIEILRKFGFIDELWLCCHKLQNYDVLRDLSQLTSFSIVGHISKGAAPVPLGELRSLRHLSLGQWVHKKYEGLENLSLLKTFFVSYYNSKNCKSLSPLKTLEHIFFSESKLVSLEGLSANKLKTAVFVYCNQLEDISLLNDLEELEVVVFDHCKKIDLDSDETVLALKEKGVRILTDKNEDEIFERFERE